jgi:hypothetical protein
MKKFKNKKEQREYNNNWYNSQDNEYKKKKYQRTSERKKQVRFWLYELKAETTCCMCGENFPPVLDYHHVKSSDKKLEISWMVARGFGKEKILEEIEKCILLCCNCHRKGKYGIVV